MGELDRLLATVERLRAAEAELANLRKQLAVDTAALAGIGDPEERLRAGLHAYWLVPESNATEVARAVLGRPDVSRLLRLSPPHPLGVNCERCGQPIMVKSRNEASGYRDLAREKREIVCGRCSDLDSLKDRFPRASR